MRILKLSILINLLNALSLMGNTAVSSDAPGVVFYAGIGEADFGEDPHAVHGIGTSDGGYLVVGKSVDAAGSKEAFALKVVPSGWSGYLHLSSSSGSGEASWS